MRVRQRFLLGLALLALSLGNATAHSTYASGSFARLTQQNLSGSELPASGSPVNDSYDAMGQLATHNPSSNADTLTWDALGRLVAMTRNPSGTGFQWSAVYDGLGRRLQTTQQPVAGGSNSGSAVVTQSSYDPDVKFLEAAVTVVGSARDWLVHGPDLNGRYGGLQGAGGLEAVVNNGTSAATGILSDFYGHAEATVSGTTVTWNPVRSAGYGPQPGVTTVSLDATHDLAAPGVVAWRGKYIDPTGFYYLYNRYYDPSSGTFLSADPLGHDASMDLYSYCNGDPVNSFDAEGLFGTQATEAYQNGQSEAAGAQMFQSQQFQQTLTDIFPNTTLPEPDSYGTVDNVKQPISAYEANQENASTVNAIPIIGGFKQIADGIAGHDIISGQSLDGFQRAGSLGFGVFGVLPVTSLEKGAVSLGEEGAVAAEETSFASASKWEGSGGASPGPVSWQGGSPSYNPENYKMYLSGGMSPASQDAIVGHELVHFDQFGSKPWTVWYAQSYLPGSSLAQYSLESEAYRAQAAFTGQAYNSLMPFNSANVVNHAAVDALYGAGALGAGGALIYNNYNQH